MNLHRHNYTIIGFFLGLGAPLGGVVLHAFFTPPPGQGIRQVVFRVE